MSKKEQIREERLKIVDSYSSGYSPFYPSSNGGFQCGLQYLYGDYDKEGTKKNAQELDKLLGLEEGVMTWKFNEKEVKSRLKKLLPADPSEYNFLTNDDYILKAIRNRKKMDKVGMSITKYKLFDFIGCLRLAYDGDLLVAKSQLYAFITSPYLFKERIEWLQELSGASKFRLSVPAKSLFPSKVKEAFSFETRENYITYDIKGMTNLQVIALLIACKKNGGCYVFIEDLYKIEKDTISAGIYS